MGNLPWNDQSLPWQNTGLPWKNTQLPWNDLNLSWKFHGVGPGACTLSVTSAASDNEPDFDVVLPSGFSDDRDALVGDDLVIQYRLVGGVFATYASKLLDLGDIAGSSTTQLGVTTLDDGDYEFRCRLERAGHAESSWSNTVAHTISTSGAVGSPIGLLLVLTKAA